MTGLHFLGCKSCGTYDRHNQVAQVALAYLRNELKFTGSTSSVDSNYVGTSADGKSKHTCASGPAEAHDSPRPGLARRNERLIDQL
jgi:hypothetical protein